MAVLVVYGSTSHMAMHRCNRLLADYLPRARVVMLEQANHFMIVTHAADVTGCIEEHIRAAEGAVRPEAGMEPSTGA